MKYLLSTYDTTEATRSPVIIGFNSLFLCKNKSKIVGDHLIVYAKITQEACKQLSVQACIIFNETPHLDVALHSIDQEYNVMMYTDKTLPFEKQIEGLPK